MVDAVDILVYSDNADTRKTVIDGVGVRAAHGLPKINWVQTATAAGTEMAFKESKPLVIVLDGEAYKVGGIAVARQLLDRFDDVPPIVLLTARPQDQWLAKWSGAAFIVTAPYDPRDLQEALAQAMRSAA